MRPHYQCLEHGITCIDALYTAPQIACCYLLGDAGEYALVETGTAHSLDNILATLQDLRIDAAQLRYILPTHVHLDHAGGTGQLARVFPAATIGVHPRGARHLSDPTRLVASSMEVYGEAQFRRLYGEIIPVAEERQRLLADGEVLELGKRRLVARHTRGHADHHLCLFDERSRGWFTGDMFGICYPSMRFPAGAFVLPATTPTQFDPQAYAESLDLLAAARPSVSYLTHFGPLPFSDSQLELLKSQLDDYAQLLAGPAMDSDALDRSVQAITRRALASLADEGSIEETLRALARDLSLNAQGIGWRRSRRAASGEQLPRVDRGARPSRTR